MQERIRQRIGGQKRGQNDLQKGAKNGAGLNGYSLERAIGHSRGDADLNPHVDDMRVDEAELRPAAVLIPIIDRPEGLTVLLTQRTDHLDHHPGQVSFPGGRIEESDRDEIDAALRETEEEIGLDRSYVEVIGHLDQYRTGTGFDITPVVGLVREGFTLKLDEFEVAKAFEVSLEFVLDPTNHKRESKFWRGAMRHYYVFPHDDYYIWGATAGMLVNLHDRLRDEGES
jgi:8-oxo-dGTP pyrophosphatase MutT (NUDIX family)